MKAAHLRSYSNLPKKNKKKPVKTNIEDASGLLRSIGIDQHSTPFCLFKNLLVSVMLCHVQVDQNTTGL